MNSEVLEDQEFFKLLRSFSNSDRRTEKQAQAIFVACAHDLLASKSCAKLNAAYSVVKTTEYSRQFLLAMRCIAGEYTENDKGRFFRNGNICLEYNRKTATFSIVGNLPNLPTKVQHFRSFRIGTSGKEKPLMTWRVFATELRNSVEKKISKGTIRENDVQKFKELLNYLN